METLLVERAGGVVTVTLNRPERRNAVNPAMVEELLGTLRDVGASDEDRVLVLTGAGGAFCSGADLGEAMARGPQGFGPALAAMRRIGDVVVGLHRLPKPTIAKVGGVAAGLGCNLALGCDLVVASAGARLGQIFTKRALAVDGGGSWLLPRLVGLHKAKELAFFGDLLGAEEAAALGLVNRVVPPGELDAAVADWAGRLARGPAVALSLTKALLDAGAQVGLDQAVEHESRAQVVCAGSPDAAEAMAAFVQKREPRFE